MRPKLAAGPATSSSLDESISMTEDASKGFRGECFAGESVCSTKDRDILGLACSATGFLRGDEDISGFVGLRGEESGATDDGFEPTEFTGEGAMGDATFFDFSKTSWVCP